MYSSRAQPLAGRRIGILNFDGADEMDFVGPWEVQKAAISQTPEHDVFTIAQTVNPVICEKGMRVQPKGIKGTLPIGARISAFGREWRDYIVVFAARRCCV